MPLFNYGSAWNQQKFGGRVQKIPVDGGFSCPNRDGSLAEGGCIYCNNDSFSPFYSSAATSISEQLRAGREFYARRYKCQRFHAYFQSFSGTYAGLETLRARYSEALEQPGIEGLIIATRPDCLNDEIVDMLVDFSRSTFVRIELGVESFDDNVLKAINRCHDSRASYRALDLLGSAGIETCIHLIFGLPGETADCASPAAAEVSRSNAALVKLHHLQIVEGSRLADLYRAGSIDLRLHSLESYLETVTTFIVGLKSTVFIERLINRVPEKHLIAPRWGEVSESQFQKLVERKLAVQGLSQGVNFSTFC